jgi:hypothetical protein
MAAISAPVFAITLMITLAQGLGGSDTGGVQFLLLIVGATLPPVYATALRSSMSWSRFFAICVAGLGVIGFHMGSVSRARRQKAPSPDCLSGRHRTLRPRRTKTYQVVALAPTVPDRCAIVASWCRGAGCTRRRAGPRPTTAYL